MIAIPIVASSVKEAIKDIEKARQADLIELRLDFIKDINEKNLEKLIRSTKKKTIVTDRKNRINLINRAIELKANLIDLDISTGEKTIKKIIMFRCLSLTRFPIFLSYFVKNTKMWIAS